MIKILFFAFYLIHTIFLSLLVATIKNFTLRIYALLMLGQDVTKKGTYILFTDSHRQDVPFEIRGNTFVSFLLATEREAKRLQIEKITTVVVETGVVNNVVDLVSNSEGKGEKDLEKTKQSERNNCKSTLERMSKQISRDEDEGK